MTSTGFVLNLLAFAISIFIVEWYKSLKNSPLGHYHAVWIYVPTIVVVLVIWKFFWIVWPLLIIGGIGYIGWFLYKKNLERKGVFKG